MNKKKEFRILDFNKIADVIILTKLITLKRELPSIQKKLTSAFAPLANTNRSVNLFIKKAVRAKGKSCSRAADCEAEASDSLISYVYNPIGRFFIQSYTPNAYTLGMYKDSIQRMNSKLPSDPAY